MAQDKVHNHIAQLSQISTDTFFHYSTSYGAHLSFALQHHLIMNGANAE